MDRVLLAAADDGRYDVFLLAYNFLQMDGGQRVLDACREKKIGTALMKTKPIVTFDRIKSRIESLEKEGKEVDPLFREGLSRYQKLADQMNAFVTHDNRLWAIIPQGGNAVHARSCSSYHGSQGGRISKQLNPNQVIQSQTNSRLLQFLLAG